MKGKYSTALNDGLKMWPPIFPLQPLSRVVFLMKYALLQKGDTFFFMRGGFKSVIRGAHAGRYKTANG